MRAKLVVDRLSEMIPGVYITYLIDFYFSVIFTDLYTKIIQNSMMGHNHAS